MPWLSNVPFRAWAPKAPSATARKQRAAATRINKGDILERETAIVSQSDNQTAALSISPGEENNGQRVLTGAPERSNIKDAPGRPERCRSQKVELGRYPPEIGAENRAEANNEIAHKIVSSHQLSSALRIGVSENERLARGVSKFFEATDNEGKDEGPEGLGQEQGDGKESEHDEGDDDETLPAVFVGVVRSGNNAEGGGDDFDGR